MQGMPAGDDDYESYSREAERRAADWLKQSPLGFLHDYGREGDVWAKLSDLPGEAFPEIPWMIDLGAVHVNVVVSTSERQDRIHGVRTPRIDRRNHDDRVTAAVAAATQGEDFGDCEPYVYVSLELGPMFLWQALLWTNTRGVQNSGIYMADGVYHVSLAYMPVLSGEQLTAMVKDLEKNVSRLEDATLESYAAPIRRQPTLEPQIFHVRPGGCLREGGGGR